MLAALRKYKPLFTLCILLLYIGAVAPGIVHKSLHTLSHLFDKHSHHWTEHYDQSSRIDHRHQFIEISHNSNSENTNLPLSNLTTPFKFIKLVFCLVDWTENSFDLYTHPELANTFNWSYKSPFLSKSTPPPE